MSAQLWLTGGLVADVIGVWLALGNTMPPWMVWLLVSLACFVAAFSVRRKSTIQIQADVFKSQKELITALQSALDDKAKQQEARDKLSRYLLNIESRIRQIEGMYPHAYVHSLDEPDTKSETIVNRKTITGQISPRPT